MTSAPANPTSLPADSNPAEPGGPDARLHARFSKWSNLNPIWLAFGPTFQKEMRVSGRKVGTYVFRSLYLGGLLALVALIYVGMRVGMSFQPGTAQMSQLQQFAPSIAGTILWFQFAVLTFRAPVLTSGAICDEKRTGTLPALMTSPLVSGEIILGKLTSRLVQLLILALTAAPLLLAIRVFGGVNARAVMAGLAVGLAAAVLTASIALMLSVSAKKPSSAASGAIGIFIALTVAPMLIFALIAKTTPGADFAWVSFVSTPVALGQLTAEMSGLPFTTSGVPYWVINIAYNLALASLATLIAVASLRRVLRTESVSATEFKPTRADRRRARKAAAVRARLPQHTASDDPTETSSEPGVPSIEDTPAVTTVFRDSRTVSDRPVLWHELRQKTFKSRKRLVITLVLIAGLLAYLYTKTGVKDDIVHFLILIGAMLALLANAASASTGSITAEREGRTWETLMTTPVSSRAILYAKLLGAIRQIWVIPLVLAFHFVLVAIPFGGVRPIFLLHIVPIALTTIIFLCATGLFFSLVMRRSTTASSANMGLAALLWLGLPMALGMAIDLIPRATETAMAFLNISMASNPIAMAGFALAGATGSKNVTYDLSIWELTQAGFTAAVLISTLIGLAVSAGVMELAVRLMPRAGGRTS